jgi:hyaluronate lyase
LPIHISTLTSKKSYFLFDKAAVFIGCDVNANDGYAVRTVVDNRLLKEGESIVINGEGIPFSEGDTVREDVRYVYFENAGAYFFPKGGRLVIRFYSKEGDRRVALWFDHGISPKDGSYAYVLLPGASLEEAENYDIRDIEILRNDGKVQAVKEKHSGLVGIVFRSKEELCGIMAEQPMIAMARLVGEETVSLAAADPTQLLDSFSFTATGDLTTDDVCVTVKKVDEKADVKILCDSARGRAYYLRKG